MTTYPASHLDTLVPRRSGDNPGGRLRLGSVAVVGPGRRSEDDVGEAVDLVQGRDRGVED